MTDVWQRNEAERRIGELLDAAVRDGPQVIIGFEGVFRITFEKRNGSLEELFSEPGPIPDDHQVGHRAPCGDVMLLRSGEVGKLPNPS